jgi:hypothetical protein
LICSCKKIYQHLFEIISNITASSRQPLVSDLSKAESSSIFFCSVNSGESLVSLGDCKGISANKQNCTKRKRCRKVEGSDGILGQKKPGEAYMVR